MSVTKKKVAVIIDYILRNVYFEWHFELIDKNKVELHYILLNPNEESEFKDFLNLNNAKFIDIRHKTKKDIPNSIIQIIKYLKNNKIDIVETHFHQANLLGIPAALLSGVSKRIIMRRNSTFNIKYHPKGVVLDKILGKLSTDVIAISPVVVDVLKKIDKIPASKIHYISHGFKPEQFEGISEERVRAIKEKYGLKSKFPVVGVISRFIDWKGVEYIIDAFNKLKNNFHNAHLLLANAGGPDEIKIKQQLTILPENSYTEVYYENDIFALYQTFDVFVHVPIDPQVEAFGRTYIEALLSKIPSIFTISAIAHVFIENKRNALVVDYKSSDDIYNALMKILQDERLKNKLILQGYKDALQFSVVKQMKALEKLYLSN